ncbi:helix-turn-helix transcriptional regulator [Dyella sp. RRB7]|uniref:helix-turn-helix domain-containing protein n=1 Tax=Dyella sp. RRB7 TaxID=2919502 RepID=UPI00242B41F2|nr:helix-turn-helix transcriptional regulator [Dyella sp. RRB7]
MPTPLHHATRLCAFIKVLTLQDVAHKLRQMRTTAKLSQQQLAELAGVTRSTVSRMETVAKEDMSLKVVLRLFDAAGYELHVVKRGNESGMDAESP